MNRFNQAAFDPPDLEHCDPDDVFLWFDPSSVGSKSNIYAHFHSLVNYYVTYFWLSGEPNPPTPHPPNVPPWES